METIKIIDIINSKNAVSHDYGIKVYNAISPFLQHGTNISLSFEGLKNVTSGFANASIGKLYMDFAKAEELMEFVGTEKNSIWKEKIQNAIYLASNKEDIKFQNEAISELLSS